MAVSALGEKASERRDGEHADFNLFFLSPFDYTKAVMAAVWDYLTGLVMALVGRFDSDRPVLRFNIKRLAQRTLANSFLRDLSFFWISPSSTLILSMKYAVATDIKPKKTKLALQLNVIPRKNATVGVNT